jgi:RNA polymerase sigma factor (sigma-70 family)
MPAEPFPHVVAVLRRAARPDESDGELLKRFVATRDETAFAALVRRHGPMVLGVCRRLLGNHADAEDACQAVFLILVRKASSIRPPEMVAGWLHGAARNVARRALRTAARRQRHELAAGMRPRPDGSDGELRAVIDRELDRLPPDFRTAIVLCDLEGLTRIEAANRLGCAPGTVASRLARGRQVLARRLIRVGLGCSIGGLAVPELSAAVVESIVRASTRPSPAVLALTRGALRAMTLKRYALFAAVGLTVAGLGLTVRPALPPAAAHVPSPPIAGLPPAPTEPIKDDDSGVRVATVPPVVVKTVPVAGATDVDPGLTEIKVTFSKDMQDKSWSWSSVSDDTFVKPAGDDAIHYDTDKRTCVMKVKLEPGKTYALWLNSEKFHNFKDPDGRSAVPYLLVFQTKKAD